LAALDLDALDIQPDALYDLLNIAGLGK